MKGSSATRSGSCRTPCGRRHKWRTSSFEGTIRPILRRIGRFHTRIRYGPATGEQLRRSLQIHRRERCSISFSTLIERWHDIRTRRSSSLPRAGSGSRTADRAVRGQDRVPAELLEPSLRNGCGHRCRGGNRRYPEGSPRGRRRHGRTPGPVDLGSYVVSRSIPVRSPRRWSPGTRRRRESRSPDHGRGQRRDLRMNGALNVTVDALQRSRAAAEAAGERLAVLHEIDQAIVAVDSHRGRRDGLRHFDDWYAPRVVLALSTLQRGRVPARGGCRGCHGARGGDAVPSNGWGTSIRSGKARCRSSRCRRLVTSRKVEAAAAEGIRSFAVVPLLAKGQLIGSMNVSASEPGGPPAQDIMIAERSPRSSRSPGGKASSMRTSRRAGTDWRRSSTAPRWRSSHRLDRPDPDLESGGRRSLRMDVGRGARSPAPDHPGGRAGRL